MLSFPFLLFCSFLLNSVSITLLAHGAQKAMPKRLCRVSVCRVGSAGIDSAFYYSLVLLE